MKRSRIFHFTLNQYKGRIESEARSKIAAFQEDYIANLSPPDARSFQLLIDELTTPQSMKRYALEAIGLVLGLDSTDLQSGGEHILSLEIHARRWQLDAGIEGRISLSQDGNVNTETFEDSNIAKLKARLMEILLRTDGVDNLQDHGSQ